MDLHADHPAHLNHSSRAQSTAYETEDSADITLLRQPNTGYDLTLRVVALDRVVPHEHYHGQRVAELTTRLLAEGKLINPPVVAQQGETYVVLDGATRLTALRQLGYPCIVVQVVDLERQQVQLTSWNHAVYGGRTSDLLAVLRGVEGLRLTPIEPVDGSVNGEVEVPKGALGILQANGIGAFLMESESAAEGIDAKWLQALNRVVASYGTWGNVERTLNCDLQVVASHFDDLAALVHFPRFTPQTILSLAAAGQTVPAGITRFVIPGRILRLNAPLARLAVDEPLAAKQAWLETLIRAKLRERQVRYYEEPVILLDE